MKKRGFTLIEIIVCIALIGAIGIGGTIITIKNNDKNISKITKSILQSAQVYLEMETDEKGNTFKDGLLLGGTAVSIPLNELVNTGYIKNDAIKTLEKEGISDAENNYVLAAVFSGTVDECDNDQSVIEFKASWDNELKNSTEPLYMCEYSTDITNIIQNETVINNIIKNETVINKIINNITVLNEHLNLKPNLDKIAVSKEFYDNLPEKDKAKYTFDENGVFIYYNEELDTIYSYFRGAVDNNYLKLGKDNNGNDLYWRILWMSDDNRMKLVLDSEIPVYLTNDITGENYKISEMENKTLYYYRFGKSGSSNKYIFVNPKITHTTVTTSKYGDRTTDYFYAVQSKDFFNSFIGLEDNPYSNNWFYDKKNKEWFNSTNLNDFSYILKENNFCVNYCRNYDETLRDFTPSNDFECKYGVLNSGGGCKYDKTKYVSSSVGYLNYGDIIRAGIPISSENSLINSGNYLINSENNILTSDLYEEDISLPSSLGNYYFSDKGLAKRYISDYSKGKSYCGSTRCIDYDYTLNKIDGETITTLINDYYSYGDNFLERTSVFIGEVLKPVIMIDMSDVELSQGDGTKSNPYILEEKNE